MANTTETSDDAASLAAALAPLLDAKSLEISRFELLGGGAIQQNWALDLKVDGGAFAGNQAFVLRTDAPSGVATSHSRAAEFRLLKVAHDARMTVPEPVLLCEAGDGLGRPYYLMRRASGFALGPQVVRDTKLGGDRGKLAVRLGKELARLHAIPLPIEGLDFLGAMPGDPAADAIQRHRGYLDALPTAHPVLEWGLRWLEKNAPAQQDIALVHRDFRTGNYMVDKKGLTAILDWEFAGWGDPHEDLAWFCVRYWRFGADDLEAGGIAHRSDFYKGYEEESGLRLDPQRLFYWEVFGNLRWAIIALQQGERHLAGAEESLELALTGRRPAEMEWELLDLIERAEKGGVSWR